MWNYKFNPRSSVLDIATLTMQLFRPRQCPNAGVVHPQTKSKIFADAWLMLGCIIAKVITAFGKMRLDEQFASIKLKKNFCRLDAKY